MDKYKKQAFSLVEVAIALVVIGIISAITMNISKYQLSVARNYMNYAVSTDLQLVINEIIAQGFNDPYEGTKVLPDKKTEVDADGKQVGFCDRLANTINVLGNTDCNISTPVNTTDFSSAVANLVASKGFKIYMGPDPVLDNVNHNPMIETYTVFIDVDGDKGKSKLNEDVVAFTVSRNGLMLPIAGTSLAEDKTFITAAVNYVEKRKYIMVGQGLSFRQAICGSGIVLPDANYCTAPVVYFRYPECCDQSLSTCPVGTKYCRYDLNKP